METFAEAPAAKHSPLTGQKHFNVKFTFSVPVRRFPP